MDSGPILYLLLVVLIILSAFFSSTETAFSSVNKIRLKNYAENGIENAKTALKIAEDYDKALSTILVGNNVVNIASASIATVVATTRWGASGAAIATVVTTIVVLIFGEILPKSYAKENSEAVALKSAGILKILMTLLTPVVFFFIKLKESVGKLWGEGDKNPSVTEQELMYIIETIEEEGVLNEQESELVQSALEFDDITVQEVLTPRVDITAIDVNTPIDEIAELVIRERFTRMPVYEKSMDNIIGILRTRDFLEAIIKGGEIDIRELLSQPLYIHKTKRIGSLLADFRKSRVHIAVVADDYGGTMGIVTMEDLLEELVGEIWDEDEDEEPMVIQTGLNTYTVSGDMNVYDLLEQLEIEDKGFECDYHTISGWAFEMLEHIPDAAESFRYRNMVVTIKEMDDQRVLWLDVTVEEEPLEK